MKCKLFIVGVRSRFIIVGLATLLQVAVYAVPNKIISVEDFGARADGKTNSHSAIKAALQEAAKNTETVIVQFGQGRYLITPEMPKAAVHPKEISKNLSQENDLLYKQCDVLNTPHCFELSGVHNLILQGDPKGTELVITSPTADVLRMHKSSNIIVKDFTIDYDPLPFTQGTIVAIDPQKGTFDLDLDKDFPALSEYWFKGADAKWGFSHDKQGGFRIGACSAVFSESWEHVKDRIWRMKLRKREQARTLLVGDRFAHLARTNGKAAFFFARCTNIRINNVTVYSNSSSAVTLYQCEGKLAVDGLVVRPRPGTGRLISTNADAVHCQANRQGPLVENCLFEGLGDDSMNFYAAPSVVTRILAPDKIEVNSTHAFRVGDKAQIIEPKRGILKAQGLTVTEVSNRALTFDKNVDNLHVGQKGYLDSDTVYNLSACSAGFVVRNNIIGGFRGRGIVVRGGNGIIENNLIKDTSGQGLFIANNPMWPEGPMPYNTVVRNNLIWAVGRDQGYKRWNAAIIVSGYKHHWQPSQSRGIRGIVIENNMIIDPPATAIQLQSTVNGVLRNNMVQIIKGWPGLEQYRGIVVRNCENIHIERFMMTDSQRRVSSGIVIDSVGIAESKNINIEELVVDISKNGVLVQRKYK